MSDTTKKTRYVTALNIQALLRDLFVEYAQYENLAELQQDNRATLTEDELKEVRDFKITIEEIPEENAKG